MIIVIISDEIDKNWQESQNTFPISYIVNHNI